MDYVKIEERYLTYYKFFDGIQISCNGMLGVGCDLSFNEGITASYLLYRGEVSSIYLPFFANNHTPGILPMDISDDGLLKSLSAISCDYIISVGGIFKLFPFEELARGVYNALRFGGKFLLGVYPLIFDDSGKDLLDVFSKENKLNTSKKLNKTLHGVELSFKRCFANTTLSTILTDTTADEVRDLFRVLLDYEFKTKEEFDCFFQKLNDRSRLYMAWQVISGTKR